MPDVRELFDIATRTVRPDPGALDRQLRGQRRRVASNRAGVYAVVAALVLAMVLLGVQWEESHRSVPASVPTRSDLIGIWQSDGGPYFGPFLLLELAPDGTFSADERGLLDTRPAATGTYRLDGSTITFRPSELSEWCVEDDAWVWDVSLPQEGRLAVVVRRPATGKCAGYGAPTSWTRVSPSSPASLARSPAPPRQDAPTPTFDTDVSGIWLQQGTGRLLRLAVSGTYAMDDRGELTTDPADTGAFDVDDGTITFTSGPLSRSCREGDRMRWRDVRVGLLTMRAAVVEDACGGAGGSTQIWIRVSVG